MRAEKNQDLRDIVLALDFIVGMGSGYMRQKGVDLLVLAGMFGTDESHKLTLTEITQKINTNLTRPLEFRRQLVEESLKRLVQNQLIEVDESTPQPCYWHTQASIKMINSEIEKKKELLQKNIEKIITGVKKRYALFSDRQKPLIETLFKDFLCELFEKFGHQTAMMIVGRFSAKDFLQSRDVQRIITTLLHIHSVKEIDLASAIEQEFVSFLTDRDPIKEPLRFYLAQNYYLLKLLGVDPNTPYLAQESFKGAVLILDSNVVITSLLCEARPYRAFQEFAKLSKDLQITTLITNFTVQEIDDVIWYEKRESRLYNTVPDDMVKDIRGSFFRTYVERKKANPSFTTTDLFEPFEKIPVSLEEQFNIEYLNAQKTFDLSYEEKEFQRITQAIAQQSIEIRKRSKSPKSIEHDAKHYVLVVFQRGNQPKTWFLTLDTSLPFASEKLMGRECSPFCFTLDSWLECLSPFVTTESSKAKFSFIFSNVFSSILFPVQQVYDVSDFEVFDDMHMNAKELPAEVTKETIAFFRNSVLKGGPYDPQNREKYAFELRKFFRSIEKKYSDNKQQVETIKEQGKQIQEFMTKLKDFSIQQKETKEQVKELKGLIAKLPEKEVYIAKANWLIFVLIIILLGFITFFALYPKFNQLSDVERLGGIVLLLSGVFFAFSFPFGHKRTWAIVAKFLFPIVSFLYIIYQLFKK